MGTYLRWRALGLLGAGLLLGACSRAAPQEQLPLQAAPEQPLSSAITVNIEVQDTGFSPSIVSIPAERRVRLLLRNRGVEEHHYHVVGLQPGQMLWWSKPGLEEDPNSPADDHADHHHGGSLVPYHICTSRTGLCPTGQSVHAHAEPGEVDLVFFTSTNRGTFEAVCPLHPHMRGKVVVF